MKAISSKKRSFQQKIVAISIVFVLIGVGIYAYFVNKQQEVENNKRLDTSTVKQEQVNDSSADKSSSTLPSKNGDESKPTNPTTQPSTETPTNPPEKPTIERAGGDPTIKVVATFRQASQGTCELQLSKPGQQTLSYTSKIVISPSYYTCTFSIQRSTLPADNPWSVTVIHHIGSASTRADARDLE